MLLKRQKNLEEEDTLKKFGLMGFMSLMMVSSMALSGCASNNSSSSAGGANAPKDAGSGTAQSGGSSAAKPVEITFLNSKGNQDKLTAAGDDFMKANPGIKIRFLQAPSGTSPVQMASSLYAAGTPATLNMLDAGDISKFKDKALDLSNQKWVADMIQPNQIDGKTLAFPFAIEGYGLIYNKAVLDKVEGGAFDPSKINTRDDLEKLFQKIQDAGTAPLVIGNMDWSLGNHYLPLAYATQPGGDVTKFLDQLKAGQVDLAKNPQFNGLMDTFDMMEKYNEGKADPLAVTYQQTQADVATGKAAMTFNGVWMNNGLDQAKPGGDYGFISVPVSNDPADKANSVVAAGATKQVFIDKTASSKDQQEAAGKFLDWLVYNDKGQDLLVNQFGVIPAFKNIKLAPAQPLPKALQTYLNAGKVMPFGGNFVPADHWTTLGANMQKYMAHKEDRAQLAKDIENYWKAQK
jgi:raffinose/stachyose/melibiose transport system substrate-binding protein